MFSENTTLIIIYSDNEEFFKKCREIWNKIIELIGIDDPAPEILLKLLHRKKNLLS